jgi:hypothetical protein
MPNRKTQKIVTILAVLMTFSFLVSCSANTSWVKISNGAFDKIEYDRNSQSIWMINSVENIVYKLVRPVDDINFGPPEKIDTPDGYFMSDACASGGLWTSSFYFSSTNPLGEPEPLLAKKIFRYMDDEKSWQTVGETPNIATCKSLMNGDVLFVSRNEIVRFLPSDSQSQLLETTWAIYDYVDDLDGNVWITTTEGQIYKLVSGSWQYIDDLPADTGVKLFVDNRGNLWTVSQNKYVHKYDYSDPSVPHKVFESSLGWRQDFFQDENGTIWLVTSDRLFKNVNGQFEEVGIPPRSDILHFGFYDNETNALFVSTENGVFFLDLDTSIIVE